MCLKPNVTGFWNEPRVFESQKNRSNKNHFYHKYNFCIRVKINIKKVKNCIN